MDHITVIGLVITSVVVPVVGMMVWLFKFVFEKTLPAQQLSHEKTLSEAQSNWATQIEKERQIFQESLANLREDFTRENTLLRSDFQKGHLLILEQLKAISSTLSIHQEQIERLLRTSPSQEFPEKD